jgi:hypothetical protein
MPVRAKLAHADYTVDTTGTLAGTVDQAERLYAQLVRDAELKTGSNLRREADSEERPAES